MEHLTLTPPASKVPPTDIIVGSGAIKTLHISLDAFPGHRPVIVYDKGVTDIARAIGGSVPHPLLIPVSSGDQSKSLSEVDRIVSQMLVGGCTRSSVLIAIGGGMTTDLGGFVASVFMRGIPSILIPTSSLAMVDAGIGGKTAVNVGGRKNMIGTISHPSSVLVDIDFLAKLPDEPFREGLAEVVKIAAIMDSDFFAWLSDNLTYVIAREKVVLTECIARAIKLKVEVVESDDADKGARLLLNFGHTIGHAIEALSRYKLSHGEAISIGMALEMKATDFNEADQVTALLQSLGLPTEIPKKWRTPEELWKLMLTDKKNSAGVVRAAVPDTIGTGSVVTLRKDAFLSLFDA